jgi:hypothetical protein
MFHGNREVEPAACCASLRIAVNGRGALHSLPVPSVMVFADYDREHFRTASRVPPPPRRQMNEL